MLKNFLKIAVRNLIKQRVYSIINILGLSVGIASALLITIYVQYEFSYDNFFENSDRIYKMVLERKYPNHATNYAIVPPSYSEVLVRDIPEISRATRIVRGNNITVVRYTDDKGVEKMFEESLVATADSNFFRVFKLPFVKGNPDDPFDKINEVIITESTAKRYFGDNEAIGKQIVIGQGDNRLKTVAGVIQDIPSNSHLKFDFVMNMGENPFFRRENFTSFSVHMYLELNPGASYQAAEAKIPKLVDTYAAAQIERELGKSFEDYKKEGNGYRYFLQPLGSIHLDPTNLERKMEAGGNINSVYFLVCVAILLVAIACINFMNLATARSSERAREVGVRKTMGSQKAQLISQFLSESMLLSFLATGIAILLVQLALPAFNQLTEKQLSFPFSIPFALALIGVAVIIGFLAGFYPAFVLSGFNPVVVMKGNFTASRKGNWLRNGLVIFQFTISIVLIVGTLVVQRQMTYMQEKSLGFDKEQMLVVERMFAIGGNRARTLLGEVQQLPEVTAAGGSASLPGREGDFSGITFQPEGSSEILTTKSMFISDGLAEVLGLELVSGNWFSENTRDSLSAILNETAVKTLGVENPIGAKLSNVNRGPNGNVTRVFTIIGVVKDFHFQSLRDQITPLVLQSDEQFGGGFQYIMARVKAGQYASAIASIESKWKAMAPDQPFRYLFLDQNFDANYKSEKQSGKLFAIFAGLAIFVACVGLFGLSAYTAQLRTKEIGVRKVMGASVASVVVLLARDFTRMVGVAFLVAGPAAWYLMSQWLQGFAYRTALSVDVFILAGVVTLMIAWITVSSQTIKAAVINPVNSLRSE